MNQQLIDKFLRTVSQRHEELKSRLYELRNALVRPEDENKKLAALRAMNALGNLAQMFHEQDLPKWYTELTQFVGGVAGANDAAERGSAAEKLMQHLFSFRDPIFNQSLAEQPVATGAPDFEATYTEEFRSSTLPALFDRLVVALEQVTTSGEIDSNKAITALQSLIATLKKHRNSSYPTSQWTWQFCTALARNILWRFGENSPLIGSILQGVDDTMKEADVEWSKIREAAAKKLRTTFPLDIATICNAPPPPSIGIHGPTVDIEFEPKPPAAN